MAETEAVLLKRFARSGDAEAFAEIIRRHAGMVYGAALRVLADVDRAADVTQDTFLQLTKDAYEVTGSLPGWLHRVATRKAIDQMRRESARRRREARYAADHPHTESKWSDISSCVDEELNKLDYEMRDILIAHFLEGQTTRRIAAVRGVSQATISRRIEAGVANLRGALRRRGIIVAAGGLGVLLRENVTHAAPAALMSELGKLALVGGHIGAATAGSGTGIAGLKTALSGMVSSTAGKVAVATSVAIIVAGAVVVRHEATESASQVADAPADVPQQSDANLAGDLAFGGQASAAGAGPVFVLPDRPPEPNESGDDVSTASIAGETEPEGDSGSTSTSSRPDDPNRFGT